MKNSMIILLIIISFVPRLFSQDSIVTQKKIKNEIGMDVNMFIKQIINLNSESYIATNLYVITYKRNLNDLNSIRFGLGGSFETQKDTGGYSSNTNQTNKNQLFNTRIGFEHNNKLGKIFRFYYGIDVLCGYYYALSHNLSTSSGTPDGIGKTYKIGFGPVLGLKFYITHRISISTETTLYYLYSKEVKEYKFKDTPENNRKELHENSVIDLTPPLFLNLAIEF